MRLPVASGWDTSLGKRDQSKDSGSKSNTVVIVTVIVISVFVVLIIVFFVYRNFRAKRISHNSSSSTKSKSKSKWRWRLRPRASGYSSRLQSDELERGSRSGSRDREMTASESNGTTTSGGAGVDRNTSVRSIMTLPAYSPAARENERILGREGERAGIDTVVEFPETVDEEEERREGEMESLYQIRLARRAEQREREERRRLRREARARGDTGTLAELRRRAESAASENLSSMLIVEHQAQNRERRVSSVQYAELGVARHDGTRLRANSAESDNRPLLDSAASIGGASTRSRPLSGRTLSTHYRGPSASSVLSISTRASDEFEFPQAHRTESGGSGNDDFEIVSLTQSRSRSASRGPATPGLEIPHTDPPNYDDHAGFEEAPPYESPINTQLPTVERLPSIQITAELTPVEGRSTESLHGEQPQHR